MACLKNEFMKRIIGIAFALCCVCEVYAQDIKSLFVALPDSLSPLLTAVNRADFGDFLASGMKAEVKNRFGKESEMTELTDDYLRVELTSASVLEMKLLPMNDSVKTVCVVHTYMAPVADSDVSFYTVSWEELPAGRFLTLPDESDFYLVPQTDAQADSLNNLRAYADMYLLKAELSASEPVISFVYSTPEYMDEETAGKLKPYLRPAPVRYEWRNGRFVKADEGKQE